MPPQPSRKLAAGKQQAQSLFQKGQFKQACTLYEKLCRKYPNDAELSYMLGSVHGQLGKFEAAARSFRTCIELQPNAFIAHCGLGAAFKGLGQFAEAEQSFMDALKLQPGHTNVIQELAGILLAQDKSAAAEKLLLELASKHPHCSAAFHGLGEISAAKGQLDEAIRYYRKALELEPERAETHNRLGYTLHYRGQMDEAIACFERAVTLNASFAEAFRNMSASLIMSSRLDEAEDCCNRALTLVPGNIESMVQKASIQERKGNSLAAFSIIKPYLEAGRLHTGIATLYGDLCGKIGHCDEAIDYLERVIAHDSIPVNTRQRIHYVLGSLLDKKEKYDEAFEQFSRANRLAPPPPATAEQTAIASGIMDTFNWQFLSTAPRASVASDRPVFIVGMPRSGTSLTEQIIASHPDAEGAGELVDIGHYASELDVKLGPEPGYPYCYRKVSRQQLDSYARKYLEKLRGISASARFVTDKMPQNFIHLGLIALLFPKARIIHCHRDPLDTCLSIYFQNFSHAHGYASQLDNIAHYYLDYTRLMGHWKGVLDVPIKDVHYDHLVTDAESETREILKFIGLEWDSRCLKFHESGRAVSTASYDQVRQPLYTRSVQRWKNYERHLEPLKRILASHA